MIVYRVEHEETGGGPFQSEFYATGTIYGDVHPFQWGKYLPVYDPCNDSHYAYGYKKRRWGCHNKRDIEAILSSEAAVLAEHGWVVVVYEVPHCCVFISESMKQVVFDWACAVAQIVLDLNHFCQGNEVEHVPSSLPTE